MGVYLGAIVSGVGLGVSVIAAWFLLRPLFGYMVPPGPWIIAGVAAFLLGVLLVGRGIRMISRGTGEQRPNIDERHDHTMEWIKR